MNSQVHPEEALYDRDNSLPIIPSCEHIAGSSKLIKKSLQLQSEMGPIFDLTCDCEDGAQTGKEQEQATMIGEILSSDANQYNMAGVRIHGYNHPSWQEDINILMPTIGHKIAYFTLPKCSSAQQVEDMIAYIKSKTKEHKVHREIPIHVLIETHGALKEVWQIAGIDWVQVLDFGMMDFVSSHHGAIPTSALRSPGQFEHSLLSRAKTEIVSAALANGVVPSHNVTLDLKNPEQAYSDALRAKSEIGFLRMWSIYPTQIKSIIDAMKPDYSEVNDALNILIKAQDNHWGPIQYKGELHDRATYRYFWLLLQRAKLSGVALEQETINRFF